MAEKTPKTTGELVAVIGIGCVMPDANNLSEFAENLFSGRNSVREVPKERWDPALFYDANAQAPDKTYSKIGAFVTTYKFNSVQFKIPPSVAKQLDESQKWALSAVAEAFADAGYDKKPFDRKRCAVILGNAMGGEVRNYSGLRVLANRVMDSLRHSPAFQALSEADKERILRETEVATKQGLPEITEDTMPGELSNVIAGRIANVFDLSGKNFTTDAACASSLAAIDAAILGLISGAYDLVLTGGSDRSMDPATYVKFSKIGALSAKGSFPFDARADGFVMGEGCGILLLKRLDDAIRDGDKIRAVIRGVGSSSDARGKGITAPNIEGQLACLERAFFDARVDPATISLLECHGTSTKVGDVVEVQALSRIFGPHVAKKQSIPIGSVKSQVGHLKSAAGAASIIKVILAAERKQLPPSINFEVPNPNIDWANTPFFVNTKTRPWPEPASGAPRRATISSFGFGGTNFNLIIEEYAPGTYPTAAAAKTEARSTPVADVLLKREPRHRALEPLAKTAATEVLVLGAPDAAGLQAEVERVRSLVRDGRLTLRNLPAFAAATGNQAVGQNLRLSLVVESLADLPDRLTLALEGIKDPKKRMMLAPKGIYIGQGPVRGKLAMVFPGQGSQYVDMLRDLSTRFETVKRTLEEIDVVMTPFLGKPITDYIFLDPAKGVTKETAEEALKQTAVTQPAMLTADLALYRLLGDYGIRPHMVAGHSLGEYAALVAAGVMSLEDACIAVSARGREMANVHVPDLGKMASVTADPATVEKVLQQVDGYVIPANKNCKAQTVIAGASKAVESAVELFNKAGIQAQHIAVSAAFHSQIVAPAIVPLQRVFERLDIREPKIPLLSNVTADYYPTGPGAQAKIIDLLSRQVAAAVEWQKQTERMFQDGARVFLEVGPKAVLTTFTKNTLEGQEFLAAATNHPKKGGFYHFMDALAVLAAWGYPIRFPDPQSASFSLPAFRDALEVVPAAATAPLAAPAAPDPRAQMIQQLSRQLSQLQEQVASLANPTAAAPDNALQRRVEQLGLNLDTIVISGASVGLPGKHKRLFDDDNIERVLRGENMIDAVPEEHRRRMLDKNIVRLVKSDKGDHRFEAIRDVSEVIRLAGRAGGFDFAKDYGIQEDFVEALDVTSELAIAAGIEALRDAGIPLVRGFVKTSTGKFLPGEWVLPEPLQQETGVIFASAFPGFNRLIEAVSQYFAAKHGGKSLDELADIYADLIRTVRDPEVRSRLTEWYARHFQATHARAGSPGVYEFNRRFLFHVLSMGHAQLAQLIKAKGPNTQVNAACSSTTQAVAIAEDWIRTGRCKRVLVVGADDITRDTSLEWFASGFLAAGAATTKDDVREAALPFDRRRHGMIIGMGAVGLVVEGDRETRARGMEPIVEVVASHIANSAYHGSRLDTEHVATEMDRLMGAAEKRLGIGRDQIAPKLLFMSHETYTPARGGSAAAEIEALRKSFGPNANKVIVSNTKGFTGHPMGASIEDAIAIKSLQRGRVPPIANLREPDPALGDLNLSRGGEYDVQYALRLAAGFGSQIAFLLFRLRSKDEKRIVDAAAYQAWLTRMSGNPRPELEVGNRALRIKSTMTQPLAMAARQEPPMAAPTVAPPVVQPPVRPAPAPLAPQPALARPAATAPPAKEIQSRIVDIIAEKTGYPKEMLEPDLDLEADLGIDTVKQAELFGFVRDTYQLPREEGLQLKDYPTIAKIAGYIASRMGAPVAAASVAAAVAATAAPPVVAAPALAPAAVAVGRDEMLASLLQMVSDKTGYPKDMLDPNLDLEADLGIDTVKQAELFGVFRESYKLPRDENLQLKDLPTLNKIVDYIQARMGGAPTPPPPPALVAAAPAAAPAPTAPLPTTAASSDIQARIISTIAEKTGYPVDMLDPNLDLEADLGIDTVKQAELFGVIRESYQLPRDEGLQLKDYPTIAKIAGYVQSRLGGSPAPAAAPASVPAPPATVVVTPTPVPRPEPTPARPSAPASADRGEIIGRIRGLIAEKTGYPLDLLEEGLDLEADLGIDTVKQAEIFGFVRETFGIGAVENLQLSEYGTIGRVADFVIANRGAAPRASNGHVSTVAKPASAPSAHGAVHRYVVHFAPLPPRPEATASLQGRALLLWAPPQYRADIGHELSRRGATAVALDALPATLDEARSLIEAQRRSHPRLNGLVFVPQPAPAGTEFQASDVSPVKSLFYLLKALLSTGKSGEIEFFGVASFLGGDFGVSLSGPMNPLEGAYVGIAKALKREVPGVSSKAVDFPLRAAPNVVAPTLVDELAAREDWVEVGTLGGRGTLKLAEETLSEEEPGLDLGSGDVLVVTGGGSGISTDICLGLAGRHRPRFLLLGRTRLPDDVEQLAKKSPQELAQLKTKIAEQLKAKGERATPVQVEREFSKIQKAVETHATLARLEAIGSQALYRACDVTDAAQVQRVVAEARKQLGPITGLIHAAGIEESKLIVDKTPDSFDRVFDVKVLGFRNLIEATAGEPLRFVVNFSSIAGRVGNAGQADYSAANDVLAKCSLSLRQERGVRFAAVTIDWSAWAEKGMATRGSVMTVLGEAGVTPIPLQAGVDLMAMEVAHGMRDAEILVAADLGRMAEPRLFVARSSQRAATVPVPEPSRPSSPRPKAAPPAGQATLVLEEPQRPGRAHALLDAVVSRDDRSVVAKVVLDPSLDPYLKDHAVDGVPYLPGVFGVEAFAETAQLLASGQVFVGARDVDFHLPVKVLRNQPVEVTVHASVANHDAASTEIGCRLQSVFVNAKGERMGAPRIHFTGTLLFGARRDPSPTATPPRPEQSIAATEIYRLYFHGPSFQVLDSLHPDAPNRRIVGVYAWPQSALFGPQRPPFLTNPLGRELAFQTAGGYDLFIQRALALPKGVARIRHFDDARPGERILASATYLETRDNVSRYDVELVGDGGRVLERLEGFELIRIKSMAPAETSGGTVYKSRWGHDFPVPLTGARAVLVRQSELASSPVAPQEALTAGERTDQERYRNEKRAAEFFAGRLAAKEAIALLTDRPVKEARGIEIRRLETGEPAPRGKGTENVLVSITHTGDVALSVAAFRGTLQSIGIDAERIEPKPDAFVNEAFAPEEQKLLHRLEKAGRANGEAPVLLWAVKESVLKALGKGFALDLQDVRIQEVHEDGSFKVKLQEPAQKCLTELGAHALHGQTWVRDEHVYALCWTTK